MEGVVFEEYLLFLLEELWVDGDFLEIGFSFGVHGNDYLYFIYYDKKFKQSLFFQFFKSFYIFNTSKMTTLYFSNYSDPSFTQQRILANFLNLPLKLEKADKKSFSLALLTPQGVIN